MKTCIILLMTAALALPAFGQATPPPPVAPAADTVPSLRAQVAERDVEIAQLKQQLNEARWELQLYEGATGAQTRRQADEKAIQEAMQKQAAAAEQAAPPPPTKK